MSKLLFVSEEEKNQILEMHRNIKKGLIQEQTSFEYADNGFTQYVVTPVEGHTKDDVYNKTLNWIKETYKNPDRVIKTTIPNEKIRIEAIAPLLTVRKMKMNLTYVVEISVKDNKYKFEVISMLPSEGGSQDYKNIPNFKKDEKFIKNFGQTATDIEKYFNDLNKSLSDYIMNNSNSIKKDDW